MTGQSAASSVLIVTGENSGERYAAQVLDAFANLPAAANVQFFGSGGDAMRCRGAELLADVADLAAIGPWNALKLTGHYLRLFRDSLREVRRRGTRVALLVDFPDFNLRLAPWLKRRGVTVLYYISPTVWAWRAGRIRTIRRSVARMLCIFPFEEDLYRRHRVPVRYVGHPLTATLSEIEPPAAFAARHGLGADDVPIAVLPGSRRAEIEHILPVVLRALPAIAAAVPGARFLVPTPSAAIRESVQRRLAAFFAGSPAGLGPDRIVLAESGAISCLANARMGIVKSGTSTLQAALAGTPFVMVYRTTPAMWRLGRLILRNAHFSIVNLIAGREVVPELMQDRLNPEDLARTFLNIFQDPGIYSRMKAELAEIAAGFGTHDAPAEVAAELRRALDGNLATHGGT
ncbi:MAG TPA: lipid-A-disaccharide synthase [Acidobacteriota bacterium]|nr:lipid-A-disaccharide synthase [Acidobacteriota bacterium]HQP73499.1 lipid-A-disaccharide synthase [Acidobacteriota bacterium]